MDATLAWYNAQDQSFFDAAWNGEFKEPGSFEGHIERQRQNKWLNCSHMIGISMRRQRPGGKKMVPEHEEICSVACAVHNMHLLATAMGLASYWSSWFDHFVASPEGVAFQGLSA